MIELEAASKQYSLRRDKAFLLRDLMMRAVGRRPGTNEFWALRNVSLKVNRGDSMAIIGRNGAGKSTLLGMVAGTIYPTEGRVRTSGRISALLELGVGFHPDLTGRENVFLNAALLGMSEAEIHKRFDAIVDFSEIEAFIDTPIGKYSSGMLMRLGFSVAVHVDPEVMIIDEIFAVGDQSFQTKCRQRMEELRAGGTTFLVVSHSLDSVKWFCNRAIWLDRGLLMAEGSVADVAGAYQRALGLGWSAGARDLSANWRILDWFGRYAELGSATPNWIWHQEFGYMMIAPDSRPDNVWIWTRDKGWLWTRDTWFPFFYRKDDDTSYLYRRGTTKPRIVQNLKTQQWEEW